MSINDLKNPPLKEIVFTISFNELISNEEQETFVNSHKFDGVLNVTDKSKGALLNISGLNDSKEDGWLVRTGDGTRVFQLKRGTFSFHRINGYDKFNILYAEVTKAFNSLETQIGRKLTVHTLGLRYLNFLALEENQHISDLLNFEFKHPFGVKVNSQLLRFNFYFETDESLPVNVIISNANDKGQGDGLILDIITNKKIASKDGQNNPLIAFNKLRDIKNKIFFDSLTVKTLNKYNQ